VAGWVVHFDRLLADSAGRATFAVSVVCYLTAFCQMGLTYYHSLPALLWIISFYCAMLCLCGISRRHVSVRLSICLSVTHQYYIKMAKHRMTTAMSHDSPATLVF